MDKTVNIKALGANIKRYRADKGITALRLAEQAGVSLSHINNIESASANASAEVLVRIANALEISLDILLSDSLKGESNRRAKMLEYRRVLEDCDEEELRIIVGTVTALKWELRQKKEKNHE